MTADRPLTGAVLCGLLLLVLLSCVACKPDSTSTTFSVPEWDPKEKYPSGDSSVSYKPFPSFNLPAKNLPVSQRPNFYAGKALAEQPWIKAPTTTTARDGLGPLYNARTCLSCHVNGGRGPMPMNSSEPLFAGIVRLSIPGEDRVLGARPEPMYGLQLQGQSISLSHQLRSSRTPKDPEIDPEAPPEAYVKIHWEVTDFIYPDGTKRKLRSPQVRFSRLGYGELHENVLTSLRAAPPIHGLGLLEGVRQEDIDALTDPGDLDGDGVSGRVNLVWDKVNNREAPGRFGWKANHFDLKTAVAAAFNGDIGITNEVFPEQPCTKKQVRCIRSPDGNDEFGVELPNQLLDLVVKFTRNLGVPRNRIKSKVPQEMSVQGRSLFYQHGCSACHKQSFVTQKRIGDLEHLGEQTIWPYTDLLLHDMGSALADGRPDHQATGSEWRTPPLWGLGLNKKVNGNYFLLHDGRARNPEEAILWHGGEATFARSNFIKSNEHDRKALLHFLNTI